MGTRTEGAPDQTRLTKVLIACEAYLCAHHDGVLRVDLSGGDFVRTVVKKNQVEWRIEGMLYRNDERNPFECEAVESRRGIEVTYTYSIFWATPPPS
jgi:hypothetical protein